MTSDESPNFDGCTRACRKAGEHTRGSGCEFAPPEPPPMPVLPVTFVASDGVLSLRYDPITWEQAAEMVRRDGETADARRTALAEREASTTINPPVGEVAFEVEAWPHDMGANGHHWSSGTMPAAEVARELRTLADRIEADWSTPECPWPDEHAVPPTGTDRRHGTAPNHPKETT